MQADQNAKQQVVERIKSTTNILVTVSRNPSVDELSAALGLTLMLNKLDKHATAVFSGAVPPAIEFLEPGKTFENTVDSLRDFIIALDKEKADRLRYKVEEDVVRIFITPYKTTITDKDLNFSQGDFNVELIVALGVEKRDDIDAAVTAHGRILHDATVVTINASAEKGSIGSIDWNDASASSLCEMLMSLSEALQSGILDQQMSTALLTGIVSATDRFRNEHTSPKVMTMAAQLMAAGANQQLIATQLEESHELASIDPVAAPDGSKHLTEGASEKLSQDEPAPQPVQAPKPDGEMTIAHEAPAEPVSPAPAPAAPVADAEAELAARLDASGQTSIPAIPADDLRRDLLAASEAAADTPSPIGDVKTNGSWRDRPIATPTFGGTLSATVDVAEEDKRREDESDQNHVLLSHDGAVADKPPQFDRTVSDTDEPVSGVDESDSMPVEKKPDAVTIEPMPVPEPILAPEPEPTPDPFSEPIKSEPDSTLSYEPTPEPHEVTGPTLAELEAQAHASAAQGVDDARAAVDAALSSAPFNPAGQPLQSVGAQSLGEEIRPSEPIMQPYVEPAPVVDAVPIMEPLPVEPPAPTPVPTMPPLPDFSTLPPLPGEQPPHPAMTDPSLSQDATVVVPTDPGQFKIPGSN